MSSWPRRVRGVVVATAAISLALVVGSSGGASADEASDGLWYYDLLHVQDAHDAGFTGKGVTVAVIDSPINLAVPTLADADITVGNALPCFADGKQIPSETDDYALSFHGTNVASLIVGSGAGYNGHPGVRGVAPGVTLRYYAAGGVDATCEDASGKAIVPIAPAIDQAVADGADIISMSVGSSFDTTLATSIARAERAGVVLVFALTNHDAGELNTFWTQEANGVVSVQAADRNLQIEAHDPHDGTVPQPNLDPATDVIAPGVGILFQGAEGTGNWQDQSITNGTSLATPIVAGFLADVWQKYPKATANQMIQTLIHNTGATDHPLVYDDSHANGYGFVSLAHMLREDPTQYPDKNPLVTEDGVPSPEDILGDTEALPTPSAASQPSSALDAVPLVAVGVVGGLLVIGVVVLIAVLAARRSRSRAGT